ncbi:hypothetical protein [Ornithinimicrobium sp. INDO-MA30-4]|uniref:hypothetical protein n=1 Tax=Ornithinimicrobium sp. INDO-MA30-4 TaxID=2908651 RepID=UPI001F16B52D|nr:hypothetical protein [Ornithinimicrobium sp. INDO-MA30-4]UJH70049.1 hypothetical protein L0A91_12690 [Ornithinimicrobium sp. INDO-MA30-4]
MNPSTGGDGSEPDPTGVRDLLRALPDPGAMPAGLEARIDAALRAEQAQRSRQVPVAPPANLECMAPVADLAEHRRRRVHPLLVAAASVAAFAGIGGLVVSQVLGSNYDVTALYGNSAAEDSGPQVVPNASDEGNFADNDAAGGDAAAEGAESAAPALDPEANNGLGTIQYADSSVTIEEDTFAEDVSAMLPVADYFVLSPRNYPTQTDRLGCIDATGEELASGEWSLVYTTFDANAAVVVVRDQGEGVSQAWAISSNASKARPTLKSSLTALR